MDSVGSYIIYGIVALSIVVFSVLTVTTRKILRSATYLLFTLFATAGLYFLLDYEFLGAVQIAVYAGGIVVLFVFSILLTSRPGDKSEKLASRRRMLGGVAALATLAVVGFAIFAHFSSCQLAPAVEQAASVDMTSIGHFLLGTEKFQYLLPFEAISVLLLACIIGGVVVARRR
ncbi:MAG: NADH-quinone oxidoreductase subunit J [Muribaculaceae bacterium]|nr:NADH-quinone oxidoreductase subunit J [Muribaculaceae bacterium]